MAKKRIGRPKIKLDYELIEKLAQTQCTQEEIASIVGVHRSTLLKDEEFCRIYKKGKQSGKISLRRLQWKSAEKGNITMLIHLGKHYLDQREGIGEESLPTPTITVLIDTKKQSLKLKKVRKSKQ